MADSLLKKQTVTRFEIGAGDLRGGRKAPLPRSPASVLSSIADHRSKRDLERSLARDLSRMRAFYTISLLASSEAKPEEIGARILNEFARTMEFRRAEIWLLGKDRRLRRLAWHGRVPGRLAPGGVPLRRCAFGRVLSCSRIEAGALSRWRPAIWSWRRRWPVSSARC